MDHISPWVVTAIGCLFIVAVTYYPVWKIRNEGRFSPLVENRLRLPGESVRSALSDLLGDVAVTYCLMCVAMMSVLFSISLIQLKGFGLIVLFVFGFAIFCTLGVRLNRLVRTAMNYKIGLEGEEYTGQELNLLARKGAYIFHDIPYKYGNIDHVVIGYEKIFVVETKAVRKPRSKSGNKESEVSYDGKYLRFPHYSTDKPITQAQCHADYLSKILAANANCAIPVVPLVALPGWFVNTTGVQSCPVKVFNPKRGKYLGNQIGEYNQIGEQRQRQFLAAVKKIESLARIDTPLAKITDADAADHYNLLTNEYKAK